MTATAMVILSCTQLPGCLRICRTFMGVIEMDPVQLLEDGVRVGIRHRIAAALQAGTAFSTRRLLPMALLPSKSSGGDGGPLHSFFGGPSMEAVTYRCAYLKGGSCTSGRTQNFEPRLGEPVMMYFKAEAGYLGTASGITEHPF